MHSINVLTGVRIFLCRYSICDSHVCVKKTGVELTQSPALRRRLLPVELPLMMRYWGLSKVEALPTKNLDHALSGNWGPDVSGLCAAGCMRCLA